MTRLHLSARKDANANNTGYSADQWLSHEATSLVADWKAFYAWAKEAGYDESYLNQYDSKCLALQEQFLDEAAATENEVPR